MQTRLAATVAMVALWAIALTYTTSVTNMARASLAVNQLSDNMAVAASGQTSAQTTGAPLWGFAILTVVVAFALFRLWRARVLALFRYISGPIALIALGAVGCTPMELVKEIGPNETAFVIPLEGATADQGKFASADYLESRKVATKRITIPTRYQGGTGSRVLPLISVITVDRSPVVREWTQSPGTGSSETNQAIRVESVESIDFLLGVNAAASVTETDASKFLYHYAGVPLTQVMDTNVRGFVQRELFAEFGSRTLENGRRDKKAIFAAVEARTKEFFNPLGVTIAYVGGAEGLTYTDPAIQESINQVFLAAQDAETAKNEVVAQEERNKAIVSKAQAEATARRAQAEALSSNPRLVDLEAIGKWDGKLPQQMFGNAVPFVSVPSK